MKIPVLGVQEPGATGLVLGYPPAGTHEKHESDEVCFEGTQRRPLDTRDRPIPLCGGADPNYPVLT